MRRQTTVPGSSAPGSLPLQTIGILSALIFTLNFTLEGLILLGQGRSHQLLLLALLAGLALWALCEALLLQRQGTATKLHGLLMLLFGQFVLECVRAALLLAWPPRSTYEAFQGGALLGGLMFYLSAYGLLFLFISRSLIRIHTAELDEAYRTIVFLEHSALKLTEAIPVGTYVLEVSRQGQRRFTFLSKRFLEMLGVSREALVSDPASAYRYIHPQDTANFMAQEASAIEERRNFNWEGRLVLQERTCWMRIEAVPRELLDGSLAFEGVMIDITAYKLAQSELRQTYEQLTQVAIEKSRREERDRLLQDMHDGFGSQLAAVRMMAERGHIAVDEIAAYLQEISADLHLVVDTLSQSDITLEDALHDMQYRIERRFASSPVEFEWSIELDDLPTLSTRCIMQILRILQEALNNALRHAKASRITLSARYDASTDQLRVGVQDDGIGLPAQRPRGRGMSNMQGRAREIGAQFEVSSCNPGTRVELRLHQPGSGLAESN